MEGVTINGTRPTDGDHAYRSHSLVLWQTLATSI